MSSDPAVAEKQTLTKQEKAKRFRDESDRLLSPEETGKVKLALAIFLRNKKTTVATSETDSAAQVLEPLIVSLKQVLDTPEKHTLFETIGLLLPSKAQREYKEMLGLQKGDARARRQPETGPPAPTPQQQETPDVSHPEAVERRAREAAAAAANPEPANEEPADAAAPDEAPLSAEELAARQQREEENRRAQAARNKRKARLARVAAEQELDRKEEEDEAAKRKTDKNGVPIGKVGGVAAMRQAMLNASDLSGREKTLSEKLHAAEAALGAKHGGMLVMYTTSVGTVLMTKVQCSQLRQVMIRLRVHFEQRDIYMSKDYMKELQERLPGQKVPQVFFNGEHVGGFEEVFKMNETGELQRLTRKMTKMAKEIPMECETCGGNGFLVCDWCGGDKKSIDMTYGETTKTSLRAALKCTACNENGLCPCPDCVADASF